MTRLSLRDRVTLASAGVLAAGLLVLGVGIALLGRHGLRELLRRREAGVA